MNKSIYKKIKIKIKLIINYIRKYIQSNFNKLWFIIKINNKYTKIINIINIIKIIEIKLCKFKKIIWDFKRKKFEVYFYKYMNDLSI